MRSFSPKRLVRGLVSAAAPILAVACLVAPARAEEAAGRWTGVLPQPINLHIVLIIEKDADGHYKGELKSPDQTDKAIPATAVEATPDHLKFVQSDLQIVYDARWDESQHAWVGTFTQGGQPFALQLKRSVGPEAAADPLPRSPLLPLVEGLDGAWGGELDVGARKLRLVLRVAHVETGVKAGLDSPDQGALGLPVTRLEKDGDKVVFALESLAIQFKGVLSTDGQTLSGVFTQGGHDLKLDLRRGADRAEETPKRPQEAAIAAAAPPYRAEDVAFDNPTTSGVKLAGTLTLPQGQGPFPAVVLVSGSGPNGRDEEVFGHKIFLVLADHLTRQGYSVLRYDKRGVAKSTGAYALATTDDFAADAAAAVAYLRSRPDIDPHRVGLIGHSEGGVIAPIVAARDPGLKFVVMMAGTGIPGRILLAEQARLISIANGEPKASADAEYALSRKVYDAIADAKDAEEAQARARQVLEQATPKPPKLVFDETLRLTASPWMRRFLAYDPIPTLAEVRVPVLALNGSKDLQVPAALDLPPIRKALARNPDATVTELEGLNHLFQHAKTGSPTEYRRIEETLAPDFLETLDVWLAKHR